MRKKVLTIGTDEVLLQSRFFILKRRYDTVLAPPREALTRLRAETFDLLLVCYSTPIEEASSLIKAAHDEFPSLCLVRLLAVNQAPIEKPIAHRTVVVEYRPESWIGAVDELLQSALDKEPTTKT